jgi:hypothetical protein
MTSFHEQNAGIVETASFFVSTKPDTFSLWHENLSGIVETWSNFLNVHAMNHGHQEKSQKSSFYNISPKS